MNDVVGLAGRAAAGRGPGLRRAAPIALLAAILA